MFKWLQRRRRSKIRARPFPPEWEQLLRVNVPYYSVLSDADRAELQGLVQVFLEEKDFEGAGGLEVTEEMRVSIAAQACMLLLHRNTDIYPLLQTIVVYPRAYRVPTQTQLGDFVQIDGNDVRLGESWYRGAVILSWEDVERGAADIHDGHNLVFHEFAHQLDDESGSANGAPLLDSRSQYIAWARVLGNEFAALSSSVEAHRPTVLDPYGAESPAEFFAVATEAFFEKPVQLKRRHAALYEQLRQFFHQDPAARVVARRARPD